MIKEIQSWNWFYLTNVIVSDFTNLLYVTDQIVWLFKQTLKTAKHSCRKNILSIKTLKECIKNSARVIKGLEIIKHN